MTDITSDLLPKMSATRLPGLNPGDGFLIPDYAGGSILNLPGSLCGWLGAPAWALVRCGVNLSLPSNGATAG